MANYEDLTIELYEKHIKILQEREQQVLKAMSAEARKSFQELLSLTSEAAQNQELEKVISEIEQMISYETIMNSNASTSQLQQQLAQKIIDLDKTIQLFSSTEGSGLQALAEGKNPLVPAQGQVTLVADAELNKWLVKIMQRIDKIKRTNQGSFQGYLSNLKGAYLEKAVEKKLLEILPKDLYGIANTGNIRAGGRQIAEDIMITFGDDSTATLAQILSNPNFLTKKGRISIPVPIYQEIQQQGAGISIKAGTVPIKFFEGNLSQFFNLAEIDIRKYHQFLLWRENQKPKPEDNAKGAILNRFIVASNLNKVIGQNNLFLATRNNLLTSMGKKLEELKPPGHQLYMTAYHKTSNNNISGRVIEPKF